jgi:hypothetical protein
MTRTQEVDQSLQFLVQSNMHTLSKFLDFHMAHLQNFTAAVQQGSETLGLQLDGNTKKLQSQAEKIEKMGAGGSHLVNWVVLASALWQIVRTWSTVAADHLLVLFVWVIAGWWLFPGLAKVFGNSATSTMSSLSQTTKFDQLEGLLFGISHKAATWMLIYVLGIAFLGILAGLAGFMIARYAKKHVMVGGGAVSEKQQA